MDALRASNKEIYPNILRLLQILATLPVSTTTNERCFSNLKRIKTHLRNSMTEAKINGLAILSIQRDMEITSEEVLDEIGKSRLRLDFII
ncbi:52 kDa repressor of the inhibitor of the protein kinase-like [Anoplophora glabripennis]|uniref:52 kDa repressor of the inhibitor of the protein kinase-like n=1 Tax=Anoplophora glabripennis TaxID=217634 RepID=UPI000C78CAE5|nr:52 kDa repressor of the inhibitor of the protein kinase-like [Anoplophora glabripennis]